MGFSTGGLIFKNAEQLTDEDILATLRRESFGYADDISFEKATASTFTATAIGRVDNNVFVLGRDIPHSCSFEGEDLSKLDERLQAVSKEGDIICFLSNSVSGVYAWSIFREGKREHTVSAVAGQSIADIGNETIYDKGLRANENDLVKLLENFSGQSFADLVSDRNFSLKAYYK
jgi:hypothetical protein